LKVIVADDAGQLARYAADWFLEAIAGIDAPGVVLPTGNTPLGMFREIASSVRKKEADLSRLTLFELDEYHGIDMDDRRSLGGWLERDFLTPAGLQPSQLRRFNSRASDPSAEAEAMDTSIAKFGGIDALVVGLGPNGHIGFNEPGSSFDSPSRLVDLTPESWESNSAYWGDMESVPKQAFTLGFAVLKAARRALIIVSGAHKAEILARVLDGPVTPDVPGSIFRTLPQATLIADREALSLSKSPLEDKV
jgi:glucosamine-6-phosphate deaminase